MRLLAVHPSAELYGSDRSFAAAVSALDAGIPDIEIEVFLPHEGPILNLDIFSKIKVVIEDMWIARRSDFSITKLPGFFFHGITRIIKARTNIHKYDFIYIDTLICFDYIFATMLSRKRSAIHIREIPTGFEMIIFRLILILSRSYLIFNSHTTRNTFRLPSNKADSAYVVYNGTAVPDLHCSESHKTGGLIRVLMIGRFNSWKGQDVLISAISAMSPEQRACFEFRIVGGVFADQAHFLTRIVAGINFAALDSHVTIVGFKDDPADEYQWADIVVVPSIKPEPFGRVAIEAMASSCAVIASNHGGLTEIVVDGQTGQLIPPSKPEELREALLKYSSDRSLMISHGRSGYLRFIKLFTEEAAAKAIVDVFNGITAG